MPNDTTTIRTPPATSESTIDAGDPSRRRLRRGGIYGLAASAAYLASGVLTSFTGSIEAPEDATDMDRYLAEVGDAQLGFVLYAIAGLALCVLYVPMSRAVTALLGSRRAARAGTASVIVGLVVLVPAYVIAAVASVGLVDRHDAGSDTETLFDAYEVMSTIAAFSFGLGSFLSLGVGPLLWGLAGRVGRELPGWIWGLAIVIGVSGLVWLVPLGAQPVMVVLVNVLGSLVLFVAISRELVRAG